MPAELRLPDRRETVFRALKISPAIVTMLFAAVICHGAWRQQKAQSDWSSGPGVAGPTADWASSFSETDGVSWRAVPGQLALASTPLGQAVEHPFDLQASGALKVFSDDVDSDGDIDVLVAAYWDDTITLWHNLGGSPLQWRSEVIVSGFVHPVGLATADVDGDGRVDILGSTSDSGEVTWWRNLGGDPPGWARFDVSLDVAGGHDVVGADLDSDGDLDLVVPASEDDELMWFRNDGGEPVQWVRHVVASGWDYPCKAAVADLDDDGDLDLVATAWQAEEVAWWRNDGGQPIEWTRQTIVAGFTGTHWVDCADVDGDGRVDVLAAAMSRSEVAWWRNLGGEPVEWQRRTITVGLIGAVSLHPADLDGDGDVDVAASGWAPHGGVDWFENTGAGLAWQRHRVAPDFGESSSVHTADVDGDGDLDLLASSWSRGEVTWWELTEFRDHGDLTGSILDTGGAAEWVGGSWEGEVPAGTDLALEARASDDPQDMGGWVEVGGEGSLGDLEQGVRYLQYRVVMDGGDGAGSPLLRRLLFTWSSESPPPPRHPRGRVR